MKTKKKKLILRDWVLYILYIISMFILLHICYTNNIIYIYDNYIDIFKLVIIIASYEITRYSVKELFKRLIKKYNSIED